MKIAFPKGIGGGAAAWISLISRYLMAHGCEITFDLNEKFDLLVNMADVLPLAQVERLRKNGTKILYRMDGLYWEYLFPPGVSARRNENLLNIMRCSDRVVFQSRFVRSVVAEEAPDGLVPGEVVYNAADPELFRPTGETLPKPRGKKVVLAAGNWGPPGLSLPLLRCLLSVARLLAGEPYEFWLFGPAPPEVFAELERADLPPGLKPDHLGRIDREQMPKFLRTADLLLYPRPNDPCPHLVIEAMACGAPIVGLNSGSMPELVGDAALLADCEASRNCFPFIDTEDIARKIVATLDWRLEFADRILQRSRLFSLESMGRGYLEQIESALGETGRPAPGLDFQ